MILELSGKISQYGSNRTLLDLHRNQKSRWLLTYRNRTHRDPPIYIWSQWARCGFNTECLHQNFREKAEMVLQQTVPINLQSKDTSLWTTNITPAHLRIRGGIRKHVMGAIRRMFERRACPIDLLGLGAMFRPCMGLGRYCRYSNRT